MVLSFRQRAGAFETEAAPRAGFGGILQRRSSQPEDRSSAILGQLIEAAQFNILICDGADGVITYANAASLRSFRQIAKSFPTAPDQILGASLREIFGGAEPFPTSGLLSLGADQIELTVSPLTELGGQASALVVWSVATDRVRETSDGRAARAALNEAPLSLMLVDPSDLRITFANRHATETLRRLRHPLAIGQCIDALYDDAPEPHRSMREALSAGQNFVAKSGDEILRICTEVLRDRQGAAAAILVTFSPIGDRNRMLSGANDIAELLSGHAVALKRNAELMATSAQETSDRSVIVAAASEEATANVQTVAAASEQLSSSIQEITRQVDHSAEIARQASEQARATDSTMRSLAASADRIGKVIGIIEDITSQTKLLALNATIEAARAGEAGKGFAVVAAEVKGLADQTANATRQIAGQIESIQTATKAAVAAIQSIGQIIERVNEASSAIASAVEQQGAATSEIARSVQEAAVGTREVSANMASVMPEVARGAENAATILAAADALGTNSVRLQGLLRALDETLSRSLS
jgi:methyl-accepting chemotaxis protein